MEKGDLLGLTKTLESHSRPGVVGCLLLELLHDAGYEDDEIREIARVIQEGA
jgi:hypothetical protein